MKAVFVDTNIIVDLLAERPPFSKYAVELFAMAERGVVRLYTSSHSIATTHYLLKRHVGEKELRSILYSLLDYISPIAIDLAILKRSLLSNHKDFEDAIQINAASAISGLDFIVTRNLKDFRFANLPVFAPDEAVMMLKQ